MNGLFHAGKWLLLDLLSTIFFLVVYAATGDIFIATGLGIGVGVVQVGYLKVRGRPVDLMQWMSLGLVVVFGGATLITHNPRFVMLKPTLIYLAVAIVMLKRGWMTRYLPPIVVEDGADLVVVFGYVWAGLMAFTALANLAVALTMDTRTWAAFLAVFPLGSKIVLFFAQYLVMRIVITRRRRKAALIAATVVEAQAA
jgi:intracellular septation protein A